MPIYNGIEFIEDSVPSVIFQTYKEWELIIGVNGHAPDSEVYKKAKKYESDKIHVHDLHEIKGKSNALNEMVKMCKYDWVCILDVDDTWHNEKLEKQVPLMPAFDVIGTNCRYFGESQACVSKKSPESYFQAFPAPSRKLAPSGLQKAIVKHLQPQPTNRPQEASRKLFSSISSPRP